MVDHADSIVQNSKLPFEVKKNDLLIVQKVAYLLTHTKNVSETTFLDFRYQKIEEGSIILVLETNRFVTERITRYHNKKFQPLDITRCYIVGFCEEKYLLILAEELERCAPFQDVFLQQNEETSL